MKQIEIKHPIPNRPRLAGKWKVAAGFLAFAALWGLSAGYGRNSSRHEIDALYVVSNQVQCVEIEDRFHNELPKPSIEGIKYPIILFEQEFQRWSFDLNSPSNQQSFLKCPLGSLKTEIANFAEIAWRTDLLVRHQQEPGPVLKVDTIAWNWKLRHDLHFDLGQVIAFDRTYEHAVIPWHGSMGILKMASLETEPVVQIKTNWNTALRFDSLASHHALLSRDGSRLVFIPDGSSPYCRQVLLWDANGARQISFPANLQWNDLLDAENINGELFFVTRNFPGENQSSPLSDDSIQITDLSWRVLASLPNGRDWRRPIWDVDGRRLIFEQFALAPEGAASAVRFRIWDYQHGKDTIVSVR